MAGSRWGTALAVLMMAAATAAAERPVVRGEAVVVTATRFPQPATEAPLNVTLITAEDIRASAARTVPDLLAEQAGIALHDLFGNNAASTVVDLRGFGATGGQNTLILVDGRRIGDIDLSGVQWSAIPLNAIERIEIVRGGGSVLYGDGATGGVINIITRSPLDEPDGASLGGKAGRYATTELYAEGNYTAARAGLHAGASNFESDGYRVNNHNRQATAQADVRWLMPSGQLALKLGADRQGIRLPGARTVQPSIGVDELAADRRGTSTPLDYAQRDGNRATLDWDLATPFGAVTLAAGWRDKAQRSFFDFGGFPDYRTSDLEVWSLTPRAKITHALSGAKGELIVGVDWYRWDYRLHRSNSAANSARPINSVAAVQENTALYLHDTLRIGSRWTMTAGARLERYALEASDRFDPTAPGAAFGSGAPAGSQREWAHAYEAGIRYQFDRVSALTAKLGRSYRFATVDEVYETSPSFHNEFQFLRPQTARDREIAYEARGRGAVLRAALFEIDVDDEIHLDAFTTGIGNTNLPPSRRRGMEIEARWPFNRALMASVAYSYTDARFRSGVLPGSVFTEENVAIAGKRVPLVPQHTLTLRGSWALDTRTRLNGAINYVGRQFMDNDEANTAAPIPSYVVVDLKLSHERGPLRITAALNNLTSEKYYNYAVRSQFIADRYNAYPLPERSFF
ncbi:MAG TPA: TonB-dependent receptor, partial [Burkholderiales bacterium]|nr:TonB-dependent receptor [Burkholderiales bacterium]